MIVRPRPRGIEYFFLLRGSILPNIWHKLLVTMSMAAIVTMLHGSLYHIKIRLTPIPFSLMGLALAIFLGFRNSASYERYWEGRRLWGSLAHANRDLVRQLHCFLLGESAAARQEIAALRKRMLYSALAFAHALRHQLRDEPAGPDLARLLPAPLWASLQRLHNPAAGILHSMHGDLRRCLQAQWLSAPLAHAIDRSLSMMAEVQGGCERIKNTPIPFSYSVLLHRTVYVYCYLLPFGLVDSIGSLTPVVVGVVSYTFFGLDAIGDEIEEPFGLTPNDLPLSALSFEIEICVRELMGDTDIPAMPGAVDFCLR